MAPQYEGGRLNIGMLHALQEIHNYIARSKIAPAASERSKTLAFLKGYLGYFIAVPAVLFVIFLKRWRQILVRLRRCPQCKHRTLRMRRQTVIPETGMTDGYGEERITCKSCDFYLFGKYVILKRNTEGILGGGFGAGGILSRREGARGSYAGDPENREFGSDGRRAYGSHKHDDGAHSAHKNRGRRH